MRFLTLAVIAALGADPKKELRIKKLEANDKERLKCAQGVVKKPSGDVFMCVRNVRGFQDFLNVPLTFSEVNKVYRYACVLTDGTAHCNWIGNLLGDVDPKDLHKGPRHYWTKLVSGNSLLSLYSPKDIWGDYKKRYEDERNRIKQIQSKNQMISPYLDSHHQIKETKILTDFNPILQQSKIGKNKLVIQQHGATWFVIFHLGLVPQIQKLVRQGDFVFTIGIIENPVLKNGKVEGNSKDLITVTHAIKKGNPESEKKKAFKWIQLMRGNQHDAKDSVKKHLQDVVTHWLSLCCDKLEDDQESWWNEYLSVKKDGVQQNFVQPKKKK